MKEYPQVVYEAYWLQFVSPKFMSFWNLGM